MNISVEKHQSKLNQKERAKTTFFLFAYNQEEYIAAACRSAFAQTYSPLEIIISDDCSKDKTYEIIEKLVSEYDGEHRVICRQNKENLGLIQHVNKAFQVSTGELIVAAAGDDISMPNRVECLVRAYIENKKTPLVIHSSVIKINQAGDAIGVMIPPVVDQKMNLLDLAVSEALYIGATGAWSRKLHEKYGPIVFNEAFEDLVFGFRAALENSLVYLDVPLVKYRVAVGLSSFSGLPFIAFKRRLIDRRRKIKAVLDSFTQRLQDMDCVEVNSSNTNIANRIAKIIKIQEARYMYYANVPKLIAKIFSKDSSIIFRVIGLETKYVIGSIVSRVRNFINNFKRT